MTDAQIRSLIILGFCSCFTHFAPHPARAPTQPTASLVQRLAGGAATKTTGI